MYRAAQWTPTTELLALLAELLDAQNRMFWRAHFKGDPPRPIQIERPFDRPKPEKTVATPQEMRRFFGRRGIRYAKK